MPAQFSVFLQRVVSGVMVPVTGVYVQFVNNESGVGYVTTAATDAAGKTKFTVGPPGGIYTVYTNLVHLAALDPGWVLFGDDAFVVSYTAGDDMVPHSVTSKSGSPYTQTANPGGIDIGGGNAGSSLANGLRAPGLSISFNQDTANFGTPSAHLQAATGALNSKALFRLMPTGSGASATTGDRTEWTLMGTTYGSGVDWWVDRKTRQRTSDGVRFSHTLTDSDVGTEPITRVVFEIDGTAHSTGVEQFTITRNAFIDAATGDTQVMLDILGDTGMTGLANTKIAINGLKLGPATSGATIQLILDDGSNRTIVARQTGANGDFIIRNLGTGNVTLRPNDASGNDFIVATTGIFGPASGPVNFGTAVVALGGGAAPTLGTIGGSGPATAAQNGWFKVNILGTASYLPMWR